MLTSLIGSIAVVISLIAFAPYLHSILKGKTQPHLFTWVIWSLVTLIAGLGQYVAEAGPSAWVTLAIAATCVLTAIISVSRGTRDITKMDWICFALALSAIPPWILINDPTISVCIVTGIELLGFVPTFRKTWVQPYGEDLTYFILCVVKYALAIFALDKWSIATAIYPVVTLGACITFCLFMLYARKKLNTSASQ